VPVTVREVLTEEQAVAEGFAGSPTIRVDGEDLFPAQRRDETHALSCRIYASPEGPKDHPTEAMVRAALRERSR